VNFVTKEVLSLTVRTGHDSLAEVVTMAGVNLDLGPAWQGSATLDVFDSPSEELVSIAPREIIAGYFRTVGTTFNGGITLEG
jgi:hypothetical protein